MRVPITDWAWVHQRINVTDVLRGAVELMRREILRQHPEAVEVNAVLIDFFLYDLAKEKESSGTFVWIFVCAHNMEPVRRSHT